MIHWLTRKIDQEEEALCAFVIHPGFVATDMGHFGAKSFGVTDGPPTTVDESCEGIIEVVGEATKTTHGGKLFDFTGRTMSW
jgi:norsolorinic acid ketoreductase